MDAKKVGPVQETQQTPLFKPDYIYWIKHYTNVLWRWKWYIIPTFPVLVIGWLLLVVTFGKIRPELNTNVLLGLEKTPTVLTLPEAASNNLGKMKLIQSRNFLSEIVDILSLNLLMPKYDRSSIFTFIKVDSAAIPGKYYFDIDEKSMFTYTISVTNKVLNLKNKVLISGRLPSLDTLQATGIKLGFSKHYLKKPFKFKFYILPKEKAVEDLRNRITISGNPRRDPMMEGIVVIGLSGNDPELISTTINTIADKFVEKNLSFKKRKTTELMKALEKQLEAAYSQVLRDENRIRIFRENYPKVGLGVDAQNAVSNISMMEAKNINIQNEIEEAQNLLQRLSQNSNDLEQTTSEALLYLGSHNITGAIVIQQEHNMLLQRKASFLAKSYSPEHPLVKEVKEKIDGVRIKTIPLVEDFIKKQKKEIAHTKTQQNVTLNQLQGLPQKEMQLATMMRQQQINSEIYSNILSKYNQAKIADETEVPDIYIMDYSVPPEEASARKELLKLIAIGFFICVLISFGPAVIADFFDKRARSKDDLKRFLPYPLLETIPLFSLNDNEDNQDKKNDPKLVTAGENITYIHELFRSLRAKLNYRLELVNGRSFLVTSLDSGEGKSLISSNIAIMASQQHIPTLLIDGDLRRGTLNATFKIENHPGLSDLLTCEHQINEQMLKYSIRLTSFTNLFLLSAGSAIPNPTELLTRSRFKAIVNWALTKFSMVIIDAPPISPVTDAVIMNNLVSGSIFVVKAGKSNTAELNKIIDEFPTVKKKILGLILNGVKDDTQRKKYNAYYYRDNQYVHSQPLLLTHDQSDTDTRS